MNLEVVRASSLFETLPKEMQDFVKKIMLTTKRAMQNPTSLVGDAQKIPKSTWTPRPKKDPQVAGPICMSLQNLWLGKMFVEDKSKAINLETDDKEEDLRGFIEEIEVGEEMEEDIQPVRVIAKLPKYVPPRKGRVKVPKYLDVVKSALQTPLLQEEILFEGSDLGHMPMMKFEYWDLTDSENFPHLETSQLMKQSKEGFITVLQPQKWLRMVEEAGLLHLLLISNFHWAPIMMFVIRKLLFLVHNGYLWLEEPIPITVELIHRISHLPCMRRDPMEIAGKSVDLVLIEAIKKKYKLEKKQRGYVITSIQDKWVRVTTQLLAGKVMRKFHSNEVPTIVIALTEQCVEGVQFKWAQFLYEEFLTNSKEAHE